MSHRYQTKAADKSRSQYANLMEEIKRRQRSMTDLMAGVIPAQPKIVALEFCYLQLRLICELIVLSCAIAHGDVGGVERPNVQKEWNAGKLADMLSQLHPEFYPRATKQILNSAGKVERTEDIAEGYLTLSELSELYAESGGYLHIGSVKNLLRDRRPVVDFDRVRLWQSKIITLLSHHQIRLQDPDFQLFVVMQGNTDGRVQVTLFQRQRSL